MFRGDESLNPAAVLQAGLAHSGISRQQLHAEHFAVGGPLRPTRLWGIVDCGDAPTRREYDLIAVALNSVFVDQGLGHAVPYYDELRLNGDKLQSNGDRRGH